MQPKFRSPEAILAHNTAVKLVSVANPAGRSSMGARCTFSSWRPALYSIGRYRPGMTVCLPLTRVVVEPSKLGH